MIAAIRGSNGNVAYRVWCATCNSSTVIYSYSPTDTVTTTSNYHCTHINYTHPTRETEAEAAARREVTKAQIMQAHKEKCRQAFRRPPKELGRGLLEKKWAQKKPRKHSGQSKRQRRHGRS